MRSGANLVRRIWERLSSGILMPAGHQSDRSRISSSSYYEIKEKSNRLSDLYASMEITIPKQSGLAKLMRSAENLSDSWLMGKVETLPMSEIINATCLSRVADAALQLEGHSGAALYLKKLVDGNLDLLRDQNSEAKNFLWELELLVSLRSHGIESDLVEPPDIVATFEGMNVGIACKKIYSEKSVEKAISTGVKQIERDFGFGIIALNIDDLSANGGILIATDEHDMANKVNDLNYKFMARHERTLRKYLHSGRLISVLVSTGTLADLRKQETRLHNVRQSTPGGHLKLLHSWPVKMLHL